MDQEAFESYLKAEKYPWPIKNFPQNSTSTPKLQFVSNQDHSSIAGSPILVRLQTVFLTQTNGHFAPGILRVGRKWRWLYRRYWKSVVHDAQWAAVRCWFAVLCWNWWGSNEFLIDVDGDLRRVSRFRISLIHRSTQPSMLKLAHFLSGFPAC